MNKSSLVLSACVLVSSALALPAQQLFNVPLRIDMGGREVIDSFGRKWLADGPGPGDPLGIRPDDAGGAESVENWFLGSFQPDSLDALGFDSTFPDDVYLFNTIRWDNAALPPDFLIEIPVAEGDYTVNLYFNEGCCTGRHFKIEIQGDIVDDDVSYLDYDPVTPALGRVGVLSFPGITVGVDQRLRIGLLPCTPPDCPDSVDGNAIIQALEVISAPECDHRDLDFNCLYRSATDDVFGTWNRVLGADAIRVFKNGAPFGADLPGTATSFTDPSPRTGGPAATYVVQALDGGIRFKECRCYVTAGACPADLVCAVDQTSGEATLTWSPGGGAGVTSVEVRRDGVLLDTLPPSASTFTDTPPTRYATYSVTPVTVPAGTCSPLSCRVTIEKTLFQIPLRINMGGVETVDSKGRVWLGDGPGAGDPLSIRPDDAGGTNTVESWCIPDPGSMRSLGFDPTSAADRYILSTIRYDLGPLLPGGDSIDFYVELPVPNANDYFVGLYFNECCCSNRHFKIELNGEIVDEDVSAADYATPLGLGKVGRLIFKDVVVDSNVLRIGILPCDPADCPGTGDNNAIIEAIEVTTNPCSEPGFRQCPGSLSCILNGLSKKVTGTWEKPLCFNVLGYELRRNGDVVANLPGDASSFTDTMTGRVGYYELRPLVAAGEEPCTALSCIVRNTNVPFQIPLRLNMGGQFLTDSRGLQWFGDGSGPGDQLQIRVDPAGGTNTIDSWCTMSSRANADSMRSLGLDPTNPNDQGIFNTIRWDFGPLDPNGDAIDFQLEVPVPNGDYLLNFYFTECCCMNRHFMLEAEGDILDDDISSADYSALPVLGRTGRLSFDHITVADGSLSIGILSCPGCPFDPFPLIDTNAIIDAIEVLPGGTINRTCPRDLICSLAGGTVTGTWTPPENVSLTGYDVYRNGTKLTTLAPSATSFTDGAPPCEHVVTYEVAPLSDAPDFLCPGMRLRCRLAREECPFVPPVRINMGGVEVVDSHGDLWYGDGAGPGDDLAIRPDDLGGANWIENWSLPVFQPDSLAALGFDPTNIGDQYIFNTIRWDDAGAPGDFVIEIPIANGEYTVNLYFNEAGSPGRHFKIEIQGDIVDDDVSYLDYDPATPGFGRVGRLRFENVVVADGVLSIGLLPCPDCPGVNDTNPILDALEVLGGSVEPGFRRGDADQNGSLQLTDAVQILGHLFLGIPTKVPQCLDAADADDNGQVQLTDAVRVLSFLFLGVGTIPLPGPPPAACGPDPTADLLGGCVFACP
jgi:hypothetical protein